MLIIWLKFWIMTQNWWFINYTCVCIVTKLCCTFYVLNVFSVSKTYISFSEEAKVSKRSHTYPIFIESLYASIYVCNKGVDSKWKKTDKDISFRPHVFTQVKDFIYSSKNWIQWVCVLWNLGLEMNLGRHLLSRESHPFTV